MPGSGVVIIALGQQAREQASLAVKTIRGLPVTVYVRTPPGMDDRTGSRALKTRLPALSGYTDILYLDADTRVQGDISPGFEALAAGWDMALSFSDHQDLDAFWHVSPDEREQTCLELGYTPLQFQCGVMFARRNERTDAFFHAWHEEWNRYHTEDQAAFVRALHRVPLKIWVLGRPWNGGAIIQHRFGACR